MALSEARLHECKWGLPAPGSTQRAQIGYVGIFFAAWKKCKVHCFMVPSIGLLFIDRNTKMGPSRARVDLESSNLVCMHIFCSPEKWQGLFNNGVICWGTLLSSD